MPIDWDGLVLAPLMDAFGTACTYAPRGGAAFPIAGVFDRAWVEVTSDEQGAPISITRPVLGVRASDFPDGTGPAQADAVTIDGTAYQVTDMQPDGHGHILLMLKLAR